MAKWNVIRAVWIKSDNKNWQVVGAMWPSEVDDVVGVIT